MKQMYHSNAVTNIHIRSDIYGSNLKNSEIAEKFNISQATVSKWKNREILQDKSSRPQTVHYAFSELQKALIKQLRLLTWWSLDEITETLFPDNPLPKRSAVYRVFVRENINRKPEEEREKAKKFKDYEPGYLHIDVTYLPKLDGIKHYLFVAIDRATRTLFYKVYEAKTAENAYPPEQPHLFLHSFITYLCAQSILKPKEHGKGEKNVHPDNGARTVR